MSDNGEKRLPHSWIELALGEARVDRSRGIVPSKQPNSNFELYSVPSFDSGKPEIVQGQSIGSNKQTVETDTVLLCKINPRINRVWVVENYSPHPKIASTEWIPFFSVRELLPKYLCYYMRRDGFRDHLASQASGVGGSLMRIKASNFADYPVPIAPVPEQHRIVAKIEELFSELDKGIESLKAARTKLDVYRQAVLKHAFEGKLTAKWREENKDKLETPVQLLARIKREREARYEQQLQEWEAAVKKWEEGGKLGKRPARTPKLKEISHPSLSETETLPPLPDGWSYLRLGLGIDEPKYGSSKKCDYSYTGTGVLRIPNVVRGIVNASDLKGARFDEHEKRVYGLSSGDILVIRSNGSISIVGRCALISKAEEQFLYAGYLIRLRCNRVALHPEYLAALLSSHLLRTQIEHKARSTSGVNNINSGEIQSLIVPLCSLREQDVVVELLSASLSSIDAIEAEIDSELLKVDALRRSVLRKAFAGQLVAQDPHDEPASVLLDRIRAEREKAA